MIKNLFKISKDQLINEVLGMMYDGFRFVTATCVDCGDGSFNVFYHFDKDLVMKSYRITVCKEEEIPSITGIYSCAFLVENEMKELFGLNIAGISIDYEGRLLLTDNAPGKPLAKHKINRKEGGEK